MPLLDDAIDEGKETMRLLLSNPQGAFLRGVHRKAKGVIVNDDPLQAMWLARFGRMVASDAVASVTARLETPRDAGSHLTVAGQRLDLSGEGDSQVIADVMTGLARAFGAHETPAAESDDPFVRNGFTDGRDDPVMAPARRVTGRELLLGSSFRAVLGSDAGSQWTSWGQGASVSRFSAAVPGLELNGESATGSMGMDYERGPLLFGFATTHSVGEGTAHGRGLALRAGEHGDDGDALCAACAHRSHLGVGARGHGHRTAFARPRRQGGAELPHGPRDDARGDGGARRAGAARRGGRVRAGAEGGRVLGARGSPSGSRRPSSGTSRPHAASRAGCGRCSTARAPSRLQAARR